MTTRAKIFGDEPWLRWAVGSVVALLAFALLTSGIDALLPGPSGPRGSVYATADGGVAAYDQLLGEAGHRVVALRRVPSAAAIPADATLFVLDPPAIAPQDVAALRRFVIAGGALVAGGEAPQPWVDQLLGRPPLWSSGGTASVGVLARAEEDHGVGEIVTGSDGTWTSPGQARALLGGQRGDELLTARLGHGRIDLLADVTPLENRALGQADNAQLGLDLAGPRDRPDWFLETVHGYGAGSGFGALPLNWRLALAGALVAALILVLANARRLGDPDPEAPVRPPERSLYVRSLAATMSRTRRPYAAADPVRVEALRIARSLGASADRAELGALAARVGTDPAELEALLATPHDDASVMASGRALRDLRRLRR
jgi:hypothetical protein